MFLGLGIYFFRRQGFSLVYAWLTATMLWAFTITTPMAFPYWFGFMYNLGELNSILLIGLGLALLSKKPYWSAFIFGVAIWHGKIIYSPIIAAIFLGDTLTRKFSPKQSVIHFVNLVLISLSPLVLWIIFTYFRLGMGSLILWLKGQLSWADNMKESHQSLKVILSHRTYWMDRFTSPDLEWSRYTMGTKIKDLLFSLGAILMTSLSLVFSQRITNLVSPKARLISFLAVLCVAGYSFYFFFLHPYMYQRHFQPALYIGLGLWVFWTSKWVSFAKGRLKPVLFLAMVVILSMQISIAKKHPLLSDTMTYARSCIDLSGLSCNTKNVHHHLFEE
jgi:hypothetical protein